MGVFLGSQQKFDEACSSAQGFTVTLPCVGGLERPWLITLELYVGFDQPLVTLHKEQGSFDFCGITELEPATCAVIGQSTCLCTPVRCTEMGLRSDLTTHPSALRRVYWGLSNVTCCHTDISTGAVAWGNCSVNLQGKEKETNSISESIPSQGFVFHCFVF